jgi:hypothetical protein
MIHRLTDHLIRHWDAIVCGRLARPRAIHWLKFGRVTDYPRNYVYFYLFLDHDREPRLVAKVTADRSAQARLVREFDLVQRIRNRVGEEIAASIPAPLAGLPFGAYWVGIEEYAGGERFVPEVALDRRGEEARVRAYVERVVDWLIAFARAGRSVAPFDGEIYARAVREPLARLRRYHELEPGESALVDELGAALEASRGEPVIAIPLHGDVWPGNIFVARDGLRVIDWDGFRDRDASYHDIHTFLSSFVLAGSPPDDEPAASFTGTFFGESWFARLVRESAARYAAALELDPDLLALMLPLYLATMSTRREPVNEAAMAMNAKFRGLLGAYVKAMRDGRAPGFTVPQAPAPAIGGGASR